MIYVTQRGRQDDDDDGARLRRLVTRDLLLCLRNRIVQICEVFVGSSIVCVGLPDPDCEVLAGVPWGQIGGFPSPAYWTFQVAARRLTGRTVNYRLGTTLKEEVGACLLGGYGIPARVGLAAFERIRDHGGFGPNAPGEGEIYSWLSKPLIVDSRTVRYRFARQKAKYLAAALRRLEMEEAPESSGATLRDWLLKCNGIGYKTASWIARNWLGADDVAILDIHIQRAGLLGGFFPPELTVERDYVELERKFLEFSFALNVRPSELDAVIWLEMMSSPKTVHSILKATEAKFALLSTTRRPHPKKRHAYATELPLGS